MKIVDWQLFIERLRTWSEITAASRLAYLSLPSNGATEEAEFGADLDRLLRDKWLAWHADRQRVRIHNDARSLANGLRSMHRHPLQPASESVFQAYLQEHFTHPEQNALTRPDFIGRATLSARAASEGWLNDFLATDVMDWIEKRWDHSLALPSPDIVSAAQGLVREAMSWREPVAMSELPTRLVSVSSQQLGPAIRLAVRMLLLFPRLRAEDLMAEIGLWPGLTARLHRPRPNPPSAVEPRERFLLAFRVEDMTTILVAAAGETLRVRVNDHSLFLKAEQEIIENLVDLPAWTGGLIQTMHQLRLQDARALLREMKLITYTGRAGQDLRMVPAAAANLWLADTDEGRIRRVARHRPHTVLPSPFARQNQRDPQVAKLKIPLRAAQAFGGTAEGQFIVWDGFRQWHAEESNPLLEHVRQNGADALRRMFWSIAVTNEELERQWGRLLDFYLQDYLFPLSGVELGIAEGDRLCFRLTDAGRYLLGLRDDFSCGPPKMATGEIVIQPNFEVVFLAPSPQAAAMLSRVAERRRTAARGSRGIGSLFKITRSSIYAAAAAGATATQTLTMLRSVSAKPLPANVEREVEGWFSQCRSVTLDRAVLIRCPDADTAARVVSASGRKATLLTDTIVEVQSEEAQAALVKKLRVAGIFIQPRGKAAKVETHIPDFF
jgi:hypothetical protein